MEVHPPTGACAAWERSFAFRTSRAVTSRIGNVRQRPPVPTTCWLRLLGATIGACARGVNHTVLLPICSDGGLRPAASPTSDQITSAPPLARAGGIGSVLSPSAQAHALVSPNGWLPSARKRPSAVAARRAPAAPHRMPARSPAVAARALERLGWDGSSGDVRKAERAVESSRTEVTHSIMSCVYCVASSKRPSPNARTRARARARASQILAKHRPARNNASHASRFNETEAKQKRPRVTHRPGRAVDRACACARMHRRRRCCRPCSLRPERERLAERRSTLGCACGRALDRRVQHGGLARWRRAQRHLHTQRLSEASSVLGTARRATAVRRTQFATVAFGLSTYLDVAAARSGFRPTAERLRSSRL